jgi:S-formylglutathione hydrolase
MNNTTGYKARVSVVLLSLFLLIVAAVPIAAFGQTRQAVREGRLVREKVHGASLEKSVTGEDPDRWVSTYLPPTYDTSAARRYPTIYILHGIADTDLVWTTGKGEWNIKEVMDRGIAEGRFGEMIIVIPDERTKMFGSFYTNSNVTGNWEDFTVKELVKFIDNKYRTLAEAGSRGIAGHSMGGNGALRLGMKHPEIYSVVYAMNPAVLGWGADLAGDNPAFAIVLEAKTVPDLMKAGIYGPGVVCVGQAFSPNPNRPPFYVDYPFSLVNGKIQPSEPGFTEWEQNFPSNMAKRYASNLKQLRGLRFETGWEDEYTHIPPTTRALSHILTDLGINHIFEEYNGDHRNRLWGRTGRVYNEVLPYFWLLLDHENAK